MVFQRLSFAQSQVFGTDLTHLTWNKKKFPKQTKKISRRKAADCWEIKAFEKGGGWLSLFVCGEKLGIGSNIMCREPDISV